jgi:hypothetical protein
MFAAGLLLGFSMFAQTDPIPEVDAAFRHAIAVLHRLAAASPQARHYHDILSTLLDAIVTRRERASRERRKRTNHYVSQIFTADFLDPGQLVPPPSSSSSSSAAVSGLVNSDLAGGGVGGSVGGLAPGVDNLAGLDFDVHGLDGFAAVFPSSGAEENWASEMGLLSDDLYIDWEGLWPVDVDGLSL